MTKSTPILDLDALAAPVGRIRRFGAEHDVLPIDGVSQEMFEQIASRAKKGEDVELGEQMDLSRKLIAQTVPTMSEEDRRKLSLHDMVRIITMAGKTIDDVEAWIAAQGRGETTAGKGEEPQAPGQPAASSE